MSIVVTKSEPIIEIPKTKKKIRPRKVSMDYVSLESCMFLLDKEFTYVIPKDGDTLKPLGVISSEEMLKNIVGEAGIETGIMSDNTIYFKRFSSNNETRFVIILQERPRLQAISTYKYHAADMGALDKNGFEKFSKVALPYTQMFLGLAIRKGRIVLIDSYMTCTSKPVESKTDQTLRLPLSNISSDQHICWGDGIDMSVDQAEEPNVARYCKKLYRAFFNTNFTDDYGYCWPKTTFRNMQEWEELSAKEDGLIQCAKADYHRGRTAKSILEALGG